MALRSRGAGAFSSSFTSWLLLTCGLVVWVATMLVPAHLDVLRLEQKHHVMEQQAAHLAAQRQRYDEFTQAVERREPLALELLAVKNLNLRPTGRLALDMTMPESLEIPQLQDQPWRQSRRPAIALVSHGDARWQAALPQAPPRADSNNAPKPLASAAPTPSASIDDWLYEPQAQSAVAPGDLPEAGTRLARFTAGPRRIILAAAAGLLIFAGMLLR